jgi:prepilin-type N-terminal cleavage/methylation domain-containing protein
MTQRPRPGYTLLEVLLALGIATLLLAGLYVSMDVQLSLADAGRERVDESSLARALLTRIAADVAPALSPIRASAAATGTGGSAATASASTSTTDSTTTTANLNAVTPFNCGVSGDVDRLTMFISRAPGATRGAVDADNMPNGGLPDVRRVTYWRAGDLGLARQEIARVTADDDSSQLPPDVPDEASFVIATEVDSVEFHYFDGTSWADSWDGTTASPDGATPIGPPRAVKIIIGIRSPGPGNKVKKYTHVMAIQSANAQPAAPTTTDSTTTGTTP